MNFLAPRISSYSREEIAYLSFVTASSRFLDCSKEEGSNDDEEGENDDDG